MNPYEVLGIDSSASIEDVEKVYRELAKKYHPDLNQGDKNSVKKFKDIQSAYELVKKLKNSKGFGEGMRFRSRSSFNEVDIDINDFFSNSVFKGRNIQSKIEINLFDVLGGCVKDIKVKKKCVCSDCGGHGFSDFISCEECDGLGSTQVQQTPFVFNKPCNFCGGSGRINVKKCSSCSGMGYSSYEEKTIEIKIPPGVENGSQLTIAGEGEPSLKGGKNGDLVVLILVKNDPLFKREVSNILIDVPVSYTQLALGCSLLIPCVSGEKVLLKVPPSTQVSTRFRVKGKGLPYKGSIGDMLVCLKLEIPKELNEEYKKVLENLYFLEKKYITLNRSKWIEKFGDSL